ncbi:Cationic amino acid transporter 5 [Bienertia sinuspersici]
MIVTIDHVRNRIKVWKKHYAVISEIRTYTKFKWDEERKMVEVPQASAYQKKCIENWDDIYTLFASDRATGVGAEQHEESANAMDAKIEGASTFKNSSGG